MSHITSVKINRPNFQVAVLPILQVNRKASKNMHKIFSSTELAQEELRYEAIHRAK